MGPVQAKSRRVSLLSRCGLAAWALASLVSCAETPGNKVAQTDGQEDGASVLLTVKSETCVKISTEGDCTAALRTNQRLPANTCLLTRGMTVRARGLAAPSSFRLGVQSTQETFLYAQQLTIETRSESGVGAQQGSNGSQPSLSLTEDGATPSDKPLTLEEALRQVTDKNPETSPAGRPPMDDPSPADPSVPETVTPSTSVSAAAAYEACTNERLAELARLGSSLPGNSPRRKAIPLRIWAPHVEIEPGATWESEPEEKLLRPASGIVTDIFGWRPWRGRYHYGVDIASSVGTHIKASHSGKVQFSGWNDRGYGYYIELVHEGLGTCGPIETRYAHASRLLVNPGQDVAQGHTISLMGSTGRSTGPHLHFEIHCNKKAVDPAHYLNL